MHHGYKLKQSGFRIPAKAHLQKNLTSNKKSVIPKVRESIRGEKEGEENLTFAHDSVETENNKKEVLECQLVITS
jgi:hypothetical protein